MPGPQANTDAAVRWKRVFFEARWWAMAGGLVVAAAIYVGPGIFMTVAGALMAVMLAIHLVLWAWGHSGIEAAAPLVGSSWTRAGVVVTCVALITGAAAINSGLNLLYLMFGAMIGCLIVSGIISGRALRGLDLAREVPGRAFAGRPFDVLVSVTNKKRFLPTISLMVHETVSRHGAAASVQALTDVVAPKRTRTVTLSLQLPRRGEYEFGPYRVSSRFPFGFFVKSLSWGRAQSLVVYPAVGSLDGEVHTGGQDPRWALRRQANARFGAEEFHGLREYRPGDNPKWIHWRSTAKMAKTMVREMESRDAIDLAIMLDTHVPDGDVAAAHRLEVAVSYAATLACHHARSNRRLALLAFGPDLTVVQAAPLDDMMRALALIEASPHPVMGSLLEEARSRRLLGGESLLVSLGADGARSGSLRRDLGDGVAVLDVSHPHFGALFACPPELQPNASPHAATA